MAKNGDSNKNSKAFILLVILLGGIYLWFNNKTVLALFIAYSGLIISGLIIFVVFPFIAFVLIPYFSRLYHHFQRASTMETVRVIFSRKDEQKRTDLINFFDFLNGTLLPEFYSKYMIKGANTFVWEIEVDESGEKNIYLSATGGLLKTITHNFQAIHQNIRFEKVEPKSRPVPNEFMQLRLEKSWTHSIEAGERGSKIGPIEYEKSLTDSLLNTMESKEGDAGVQFVITPVSPRKQSKQRFEHDLAQVGGALFEVEIRIYAPSQQIQKGIIGTIGEVNANNNIIAERIITYGIRRLFRNYWWKHLYEKKMPSLFLGPKMWFMSFHLAALLEIPSPNLQVSGLDRFLHKRLPIPQGIPVNADFPLVETEDGLKIGLTEAMRARNLMVIGTGGTGKSTTMAQNAIPIFADPDQASVVIASAPHEAQIYLQYIPPHKKVYIIDMLTPAEAGINFLSLDQFPADLMVELICGLFDTVYDQKIPDLEILKEAYLSLRKAREVSPEWKKAIPSIDFRHIRELLINEKYRLKLIQVLPKHSTHRTYWMQKTQQIRNDEKYRTTYITPILNLLSRILSVERLEKGICHPVTFDLRKALLEEKAVVVFHSGRWDFGFDLGAFFNAMFLAFVYLSIFEQRTLPPEEKVNVNLFLDDFGMYAGRSLMMLLVRAWMLGVRVTAASGTFFDIPEKMRIICNIAFANKIIFRVHNENDAKHWAGQIPLIDEQEFLHLRRHYAVVWLTVDNERKDVFIARAVFNQELNKWANYHPWPTEKEVKLHKVVMPNIPDDDFTGDFEVSFKSGT